MNRNVRAANLYAVKIFFLLCIAFLSCVLAKSQNAVTWSTTNFGIHKVGFTNFKKITTEDDTMLINIWYPATTGGTRMTLKDYIIASSRDNNSPDSLALNDFKRVLELPFLFHLPAIPQNDYNKVLSSLTNTYRNAQMMQQKFPLVIAFCEPQNYITTFEFLASHGYCIASVTCNLQDETNDSLYYVKPTKILGEFLNYMQQQSFTDTAHIAAIGHGWGIEAPFYLAMKTHAIKLLINLDGAVFGFRSKSNLSSDYHAAMLTIPMLHITSVDTRLGEDAQQFAVLTNPRYRINILSDSVSHHDFSTYGRVAGELLQKRPSIQLIDDTYNEVHKLILYFLQQGTIDASVIDARLVELQKF